MAKITIPGINKLETEGLNKLIMDITIIEMLVRKAQAPSKYSTDLSFFISIKPAIATNILKTSINGNNAKPRYRVDVVNSPRFNISFLTFLPIKNARIAETRKIKLMERMGRLTVIPSSVKNSKELNRITRKIANEAPAPRFREL
ncbi:MAG: hypothetical protein FWG77_03455 [Treponema sp.]|nr:hypothetical protein [Treponema sp.]